MAGRRPVSVQADRRFGGRASDPSSRSVVLAVPAPADEAPESTAWRLRDTAWSNNSSPAISTSMNDWNPGRGRRRWTLTAYIALAQLSGRAGDEVAIPLPVSAARNVVMPGNTRSTPC